MSRSADDQCPVLNPSVTLTGERIVMEEQLPRGRKNGLKKTQLRSTCEQLLLEAHSKRELVLCFFVFWGEGVGVRPTDPQAPHRTAQ